MRRAELLNLLSIERGLFLGWEERGLFQYEGPQDGKRLYSAADYLRLAVAKRLVDAGFPPGVAFELLNSHKELILGNVCYYVGLPLRSGVASAGMWRVIPDAILERELAKIWREPVSAREILKVNTRLLLPDAIERLIRKQPADDDEAREFELTSTLQAIQQRISEQA